MDNTKPVTAADIAKMKKNGKTMLAIAAAVLVLVIILTAMGGAPTWMIVIVGMTLTLGSMELWKAKKAEKAMSGGSSSMTPPSTPGV